MLTRLFLLLPLQRLVFAFSVMLITQPVSAAGFSRDCKPSKTRPSVQACIAKLSGDIQPGDTAKLTRFLEQPENREVLRTGWILLDSPGGDVEEAIRLGRLLQRWAATATNLGAKGPTVCASACFLVWVSAAQRTLTTMGGGIGLHRPYLSDGAYRTLPPESLARLQSKAAGMIRDYLQSENVPQRLIDAMMRHPSNDIYWLTIPDYQELGELSPWFEEIVVRQCKYDRNLAQTLFEKSYRHEITVEEAHLREIPKMECVRDAQERLQRAFFKELMPR